MGRNRLAFSMKVVSVVGFLALLLANTTLAGADPGWWNSSWNYRKTLNFTKWTGSASDNLTNFPVLVKLNSTYINYAKTKDDGTDLRFIDNDGLTELKYHIELWNESGDSYVWVKVPLVENNSQDYIWMYYNNSAATSAVDEHGTYDDDYVGVWHLNGTSPDLVKDFTQYGNNGTFNGSSLEFDGVDDYVDAGSSPSLNITSGTLEAWVKVAGEPAVEGEIFWVDNIYSFVFVYKPGGDLEPLVSTDGSSWTAIVWKHGVISLNKWYHIAATYDEYTGDLKLYVNGELVGSDTSAGGAIYPNTGITIGARSGGSYPFNGTIDEVRIYNRSLSATEVKEHYRGNFSNETGLVMYIPFKEGTGTTAADLSGQGNDGTLDYSRTLVESCDSTTGWCPNAGSVSSNTATYKEGSAALNLIKTSTTTADSYYPKDITSTNMQNKYVNVWLYIKDTTTLNKISQVQIYLFDVYCGGSWTWYSRKDFASSSLNTGWNLLSFDTNSPSGTSGTPNLAAVGSIRIDVDTNAATDTYAAGDVIMDYWFLTDTAPAEPTWSKATRRPYGVDVGKIDGADVFDGVDDYVEVGDDTSLDMATELTLETWAYIKGQAAGSGGDNANKLISKMTTNDNGYYGLHLLGVANGDDFAFEFTNNTGGFNYVTSDESPSLNTWYYIVGTYNGSKLQIYVNGISKKSKSASGTLGDTAGSLFIGKYPNTDYPYYWNGTIDEVRISNVSRSAAWINASYLAGKAQFMSYGAEEGNPPPKYHSPIGVNDSSPSTGDAVKHYVNWTDESALSGFIFSWNASGVDCDTWANFTWVNMTGTVNWSNSTQTVPVNCTGNTIGWRFYANDSSGGWNATSTQAYKVTALYTKIFNPTACVDSDADCAVSRIQSNNNTYESFNMKTDPFGYVNATSWNDSVPAGYEVAEVLVHVIWKTDTGLGAGNIYVDYYNTTSGSWVECQGPFSESGSEVDTVCNATGLNDTETNNIKVRFRGNDTDLELAAFGYVDHIWARVRYEDPVPSYSGETVSPASPVQWQASADYQFNITWTDNAGVSEVVLEFDGTNYSYLGGQVTKIGDEYFANFSDLGSRIHNYVWYANDTMNQWASTGALTYTITPYMQVSLVSPSPNEYIYKNAHFFLNVSATCKSDKCGNVNGTARYNASGSVPDTAIPTSSSTPFWTATNPKQCGSMVQNDVCALNFTINATGLLLANYTLDVNFTSNYTGSNDTANANVQIKNSYELYYGFISGNITLRRKNNQSLISVVISSAGGNVYATDADSSISWAALKGLGKFVNGTNSSSDFTEVDSALNLTGRPDNITRYYSSDGSIANKITYFHVKRLNITGVPLHNNSDNSSFSTGILWDSADDGGNEQYDSTDQEDLIFITKVTDNGVATYGTYDYEIMVPETLDTYKGSNEQVAFYMELK